MDFCIIAIRFNVGNNMKQFVLSRWLRDRLSYLKPDHHLDDAMDLTPIPEMRMEHESSTNRHMINLNRPKTSSSSFQRLRGDCLIKTKTIQL